MACGLAVTMVMTCAGTSDVALAAKKPSISKKSVTITVGKKKTIKVKNASKTVKWSSSKKSVVTVKASGKKNATATLKGVSKGSATVTAKVGSKKLTCKVTVKKSINNAVTNIQSVSVDQLDEKCIVLKMKKATALNVSDLSIGVKKFKEGSYNFYPVIKTIASADQITYRIYLNKAVNYSNWVKVTINNNDSVEYQYKRDIVGGTIDWYIEKNDVTTIDVGAYYFDDQIGTVTYDITSGTLPAGLTLNKKRGIIKGIPTVAGESQVTIKATDELGRSATSTINYKVYDEKTIMVENKSAYVRLDDYVDAVKADSKFVDTTDYYGTVKIAPMGGSGTYKFTLQSSDGSNVRLSTNSNTASGGVERRSASVSYLEIPYSISEGTHTYTITVEDAQDANRKQTMTVTVVAEKYYNISGTAKDIFNTELTGNTLYFYPVNATEADEYVYKRTYGATTEGGSVIGTKVDYEYTSTVGTNTDSSAVTGDKKGTYAAELAPGEYIVKIQSDADDIRYEMDTHVKVNAQDGLCSVVAPIRFYSVSAVAKYKNGSLIKGEKVYFETKEEQYENREDEYGEEAADMKFSVKTDNNGTFIASLPANTYVAYMLDEDGYRHYFTSDVAVTAQDLVMDNFNADIERYTVEGTLSDAAGTMKNEEVRFYNNTTGEYRTTTTNDEGNFQIGLPGSTTYVVKAKVNNIWHKMGTITVGTQDVTAQKLTYSISQEFLNAQQIQAGQSTNYNVVEGAVSAKFVCDASGSYNFTAAVSGEYQRDKMSLYVFDKDGKSLLTDAVAEGDVQTVGGKVSLTSGETYYIMLIPENKSVKKSGYYPLAVSGSYTLTVQK